MIWLEQSGRQDKIPTNKIFAHATGVVGGFSSMVGNLAGSVMGIYLLSTRLPKNAYIARLPGFLWWSIGLKFRFMYLCGIALRGIRFGLG